MKIVPFSLRFVTFYYRISEIDFFWFSFFPHFFVHSFKPYNRNGKYFMCSFYNLQLKSIKENFYYTRLSLCVLLLFFLFVQFFCALFNIFSQHRITVVIEWKASERERERSREKSRADVAWNCNALHIIMKHKVHRCLTTCHGCSENVLFGRPSTNSTWLRSTQHNSTQLDATYGYETDWTSM